MSDRVTPATPAGAETGRMKLRFLGRQPIYDANRDVFGHELLFRSSEVNAFSGDAEEATRQVIDNCLLLMPEGKREISFINCTRIALLGGIVTLLPPSEVVLEILEDVRPDPELLASCRALKKQGYRFALDDFTPDGATLDLLEIADFIKVDFQATDAVTRRAIYSLMDRSRQTSIAEKVETLEDVRIAEAEGCELFQGYFLSRPIISRIKVIPQREMVYLRLLSLLTQEDVNIAEVEQLVKSDTSLCFRLLRLVNSALYPTVESLTSVRTAIMLVGVSGMRKLVLVSIQQAGGDGYSKSLVASALERAKFCEQLGSFLQRDASSLYLLGMLSLLDVMLGVPIREILALLPIEGEMKEALIGEKNTMRVALDLVIFRERGEWREAAEQARLHGITEDVASRIHFESALWAKDTYQQLSCL